jgi:hypothetical protein
LSKCRLFSAPDHYMGFPSPTLSTKRWRHKHSKTIYVFTSGPVIVTTCPNLSRKKLLKGLKWPLQNRHQYQSGAGVTPILPQYLMKRGICRCGDGDARRTLHVSIMFWSCAQKLWDFQCGSSVGQDNLTKANWPPHWDRGKNRRAHLNCS